MTGSWKWQKVMTKYLKQVYAIVSTKANSAHLNRREFSSESS